MAAKSVDSICTVISKNYLAQAKTMIESFHRHNPKVHVYVLVLDFENKSVFKNTAHLTFVPFNKLAQKNNLLYELAFLYSALELSCAMKAFFMEYIIETYGVSKVFYFDSDILFTGSVQNLFRGLDKFEILLTPHLISFDQDLNDGFQPDERTMLTAGLYNAGFVGIADKPEARKFLTWWAKQNSIKCIIDPASGYFHDQRWLDMVPNLFSGVHVVLDPGCNVAYWNLHERKIEFDPKTNTYLSNKQPLIFVHFSACNPDNPSVISRHQNRHQLSDRDAFSTLFREYLKLLLKNDSRKFSQFTYGRYKFDNGVEIPSIAKDVYRKVKGSSPDFENPFETESEKSFFHWLVGEDAGVVPPIVLEMRAQRPDVLAVYPYPGTRDQQHNLVKWAAEIGWKEFGFSKTWQQLMILAYISMAAIDKATKTSHAPNGGYNSDPCSFGVNLSGYYLSEKGVGVSVRSSSWSLREASVPFVVNNHNDIASSNKYKLGHLQFAKSNPFSVNLVHINPPDLEGFVGQYGRDYFRARHNVAYWVWEFPEFPTQFSKWFDFFDEVWVPSSFVQQAISKISPIPVVLMPHTLNASLLLAAPKVKKADFQLGFDESDFVFLFCFDFQSVTKRKNPEGLIEAFKKAFSKAQKASLVLKTSRGHLYPKELRNLKELAKGARIHIVDEVLPEEKVHRMIAAADCYVSLHRSEGFGLTLIEAMSLGKPVIATGYSGNTDFMNDQNSFLVPYTLDRLSRRDDIYPAGGTWAQPNILKASEIMRYVYENPGVAKEIGANAARHVQKEFSTQRIGKFYHDRLRQLTGRPVRVL